LVGIIGSGKVGISMGRYLKKNGIKLDGFYDIHSERSTFHSIKLGVKRFSSIKELLISSKVIMIAVPDDEIIRVWEEVKGEEIEGKTIFHTSGSLSSEVFSGGEKTFTASLHPMMTFSGEETDICEMERMTLALEGDAPLLEEVLTTLGNNYFKISKEDKVRYHLGGVYTSNLLIPMITRGIENLKLCGLEGEQIKKILLPLMEKTIENIYEKGSRKAVTGPVERGDVKTIKKHLKCQEDYERGLYIEGSKELLRILGREDKKIEGLLEEYR